MASTPVALKVDPDLKERVKRLAEARQRSAHWIMREAIRQYVDREEARESFRQEALRAWQHYQETGRHLTLEQVSAWLDTWGTPAETALPECHG